MSGVGFCMRAWQIGTMGVLSRSMKASSAMKKVVKAIFENAYFALCHTSNIICVFGFVVCVWTGWVEPGWAGGSGLRRNQVASTIMVLF